MAQVLELLGAQVRLAGDAAGAEAALVERLDWNFLVTDLGLGAGGDGFAVLTAWRAAGHPFQRAVALSACGAAADMARSARSGFAQHLVKSVAPVVLAQAIGVAINGQR